MKIILDKLNNINFSKWSKVLVFILILIFYGSFITYKIVLPAAEDLPRQMMNGKDILSGNYDVLTKNVYSYTDPTHYFANHHWLYGVFVYVLHSIAGFEGIVIFKILTLLLTFSLLFYIATRKADFWLVALFSLPTILVILGRSSARPEMFSYLFVVIYLYILTKLEDNPKSNKIFWIIPLQILWANTHIMFPVGVALVGSYWLTIIFKNWKGVILNSLVRKLTLLLVLTTLVSFVNPLGIHGVIYSLQANTINASKVFSSEVQSISDVFRVEPKSDYLGAVLFTPMLVLLAISFILAYKRKPFFYLIMSIAVAILSFEIIRGLPLFAIIFLPAITENLDPSLKYLKGIMESRWPQAQKIFQYVIPIVFIIILFLGTFVWRQKISPYQIFGVGITDTSEDPIKFFKENELKGPILNDTDIGSYLIWYLYPNEKVFSDNRFGDAYTHQFLEDDYNKLFTDDARWQEMLKKYKFNTIILNHYDKSDGLPGFIYRRFYDPEWALVYAGRDALIFIRNIPENDKIIQKYFINPTNLAEKLSYLSSAPDYQAQVAAADLFGYVGRIPLARVTYEKLLSQWPDMGRVWFVIGKNELLRSDQANADYALALLALQNAIAKGYKTPYSYSFLALAYYRLGDTPKAEQAVKEELKIDPENKDGQAWQDLFLRDRLKKSETQ